VRDAVHLRPHGRLARHGDRLGGSCHTLAVDLPPHTVIQISVDKLAEHLRGQPSHVGAWGLELRLALRIEVHQQSGGIASWVIPPGR
jgi:hypothetical protein